MRGLSGDSYKITKVTDPFGRSTILTYNGSNLQSTTDTMGMVSSYNYDADGNFLSLTTAYGTTNFNTGQDSNKRWIQATDPQGGTERLETWNNYNYSVPASAAIVPSGFDNSYLNVRNSFYWNKKAMLQDAGGLVYTDAQITHWLHEPGYSIMSDQVESVKAPLESRVYFNYPNQPSEIVTGSSGEPSRTARILDDGTTQQTFATYNGVNNLTQQTDPLGRTTNYTYAANQVDLLQVTQQNGSKNDVLASATYNAQHLPLNTTDASGQTTTYTYYPNGEIKTITNAKNETTTFAYTGSYLTGIVQPQGATITLTYDGFGRVATITDVNGYTLNYNYDNLNRLTKTTYPDGTYAQNVYTNLDLTQTRDRLGRWTRYLYNPLEQVVAVIDSANRVTNFTRCICGELTGLTDPLLHTTNWTQDLEGRTIIKTFPDKSQISYAYETSTSRLKSTTDAKEQITTYAYNADDRLARSTYTNTGVATPTVSYIYDPVYPRLTSMQDGTGTTSYSYYPITATPTLGANRLASETGPLGSTATINYIYDPLGRVISTAIGSATSSVTYDSLARVTQAANPLGSFTYGYYGATSRLASQSYPNGQNTSYSYLTAQQDFRLSEIKNLTPTNSVLSQNDYTYNVVGDISSWKQQTDSNTSTIWNYKYDGADQLLSAVNSNTASQRGLGSIFL